MQSLGPSVGEQFTTWDGKDNGGEYVKYGNYKVFIEAYKGDSTFISNEQKITVYEVRLGNCVYRDKAHPLSSEMHAGLLYRYLGEENKLEDLDDDAKYAVLEHPGGEGETWTTTLETFKSYNTWRGTYCPNNLTKSQRESILEKGKLLNDENDPYVDPVHDVLHHELSATWEPGAISDISEIRCDGVTEVSYEAADIQLYGGDTWWNIMSSQDSLDKHNGGWISSITPSKQRSSSLSTNRADSLYKPDE